MRVDSSLSHHGSSRGPSSGADSGLICQIDGGVRRCRERQEVIGTGESSEVRRRRPWLQRPGGKWERMSDGDEEERENYAGRRSQSGRTGSGGGEVWGCAGGVEKETCSDKRYVIS